jgi:large subunit ribosomal protein L15
MRDIIKKLPKLRGFGKNRARTVNSGRDVAVVVNVSALEASFEKGTTINPKALIAAGIVSAQSKKAPTVKILGNGEITKQFAISGCLFSASAKEKIEKAGGTII